MRPHRHIRRNGFGYKIRPFALHAGIGIFTVISIGPAIKAAVFYRSGIIGHQVIAHLAPDETRPAARNAVDGDDVPVRHFGVILAMDQWHALADKLKAAGTRFIIEPHIRFKGLPGVQATMFFLDPSGNALEFKAFGDMAQVFAK